MHRALELEEVLDLVFQELDHKSQASALRTCKRFFNPAGRLLWQDGISGFRHLAPMCVMAVNNAANYEQLFASPEWKRFQRYAAFIRVAYVAGNWRTGTDIFPFIAGVVTLFDQDAVNIPIFPQLRKLRSVSRSIEQLMWTQRLLCPSLEGLHIIMYDSYYTYDDPSSVTVAAVGTFLSELVDRCPHLTELRVDSSSDLDDLMASAIRRLKDLQHLTCSASMVFSACRWEAMGQMPKLRSLALNSLSMDIPPTTLSVQGIFPNLEKVRFDAIDLDVPTRFLELLSPGARLQEVDLQSQVATIPRIPTFIQACGRFRDLKILKFWFDGSRLPVDTELCMDILCPLARCHDMRSIMIVWSSGDIVCDMNDSHLTFMAESWPLLEVFVLKRSRAPCKLLDTSMVTQNSLFALHKHCPHLKALIFPRLRVVPPLQDVTAGPIETALEFNIDTMEGNEGLGQGLILSLWPNARIEIGRPPQGSSNRIMHWL